MSFHICRKSFNSSEVNNLQALLSLHINDVYCVRSLDSFFFRAISNLIKVNFAMLCHWFDSLVLYRITSSASKVARWRVFLQFQIQKALFISLWLTRFWLFLLRKVIFNLLLAPFFLWGPGFDIFRSLVSPLSLDSLNLMNGIFARSAIVN